MGIVPSKNYIRMIIYNVTVKVDHEIKDKWVEWMTVEHMPELMETGLFIDCRLSQLLEQDETDGKTFVAQYFCKDYKDYERYISDHSAKMLELFGHWVV